MHDMDGQRQAKAKQSWLLVLLSVTMALCVSVSSAWGIGAMDAASPAATFGKTSVGGFADRFVSGRKQVNEYYLPVAGTVSKLSVYLVAAMTSHQGRRGRHRGVGPIKRRGRSGDQVLEGVIYADANGTPGALLGRSNELTFTSTSPTRWYDLALGTPLRLTAGHYWVGVLAGAKGALAGYRYDRVARAAKYNAVKGAIDPFGPAATGSRQISLYAMYTNDAMSSSLPAYPSPPAVSGPAVPAPQAPQPPGESGPPVEKGPPVKEGPKEEGPPVKGHVPVNSSVPAISGTAQVGQTLSASPGTWSESPTSYGYQWQRCDAAGVNCGSIPLATTSSYTVVAADVNSTLRVQVIATNAGGSSAPATSAATVAVTASSGVKHLEYVFEDGLVSVYDMDQNYKLVKEISLPQTKGIEGFYGGTRGVTVAPATHLLFVSYGGDGLEFYGSVLAYDLVSEKVVWTVHLKTGIDSGQVSPDGKRLYMPTGENTPSGIWNILDTSNGSVIGTIQGGKNAHNTVVSNDGRYVYLGGREAEYLGVYDTTTEKVRLIGPLKKGVRPFTVNGSNTLAFTTATGLDGFQVSSITTGKVLFTVESGSVPSGFPFTAPSHGVSLSPDERELYVIDSVHKEVRVYDVSRISEGVAPTQLGVIPVAGLTGEESSCAYDCGRGGWLQRSVDGRFVFVGDSGEVIETATRKVIATLSTLLNTKKSLEIDWSGGVPIATSNRTGVGGVG
jgi:hypothetical protein